MSNADVRPGPVLRSSAGRREPLHVPPPAIIAGSQMTAFRLFCEAETGRQLAGETAFHRFTVDELRTFWALFLRWSGVLYEGAPEPVCVGDDCESATFFPKVELSYVENLLRLDGRYDPDATALTACHPSGRRERLTRRELAERVSSVAVALEGLGLVPGDRVVAVADNDAATVVAGLGVLAVGASLSTASSEMGVFSILGRFASLAPSLLLCHLRGADPAASAALRARVSEIAAGLPSLRALILLDDGAAPESLRVPTLSLSALVGAPSARPWRRFAFNQPLFILFSSGTTGPPKCILHGAGGTLLEHVKEHRLHVDLRPPDKLFFQTSCAWMMWNWQLSALASGVELVLHAGGVSAPETLWQLVSRERVTVFGTSPTHLQMTEDAGFSPGRELPLAHLRGILSTGSVLHDGQYDWVRDNVGALPLQSISGGTDIMGCFVLGNPNLPVYRGEIQGPSLGMDVQSLREPGPDASATIGELICRNPFPSRPLGLYGDPGGERFHEAYFAQNQGAWTHGDLIEALDDGGARIHGRSDGVLNVRGVRIGPMELYGILRDVPEIVSCLAVEQRLPGGAGQSRLVLLVVLRPGQGLDLRLRRRIRTELAQRGSPRHVPELILVVPELPVTHSGKLSERAARDALHGVEAVNLASLRNPESVAEIGRRLRLLPDPRSEGAPAGPRLVEASPLEQSVDAAWERAFDLGPLSRDDDFFDLGGTSLIALRLFGELRERTGCDLPPSTLFEAPTIALMTTAVQSWAVQAFAPVVPLRTGGSRAPLFVVHGLAGDILELRGLALRMPGRRPVFGLRARALDPRERAHHTIEEMAEDYVKHVRNAQPRGPYCLAGYSFGGLIAFEMARCLRAAGDEVAFVGLLDTNVHEDCLSPFEKWRFRVLRLLHQTSTRRRAPQSRALARLQDRVRTSLEARLQATCSAAAAPSLGTVPLSRTMVYLEELAWRAFRAYRPRAYDGPVTFFRASLRPPDYCYPIPVWRELSGGRLDICDVPGDHFTMIRDPDVEALARCLGERLDACA